MSLLSESVSVWRPDIPTSIDGQPLVTSGSDLFFTFPVDRVTTNVFVGTLMRPHVPFVLVAAYLASKPALKATSKALGITGTSRAFVAGVLLHNLLLATFSCVVMMNAWPIVLSHLSDRGVEATYCDKDGSLWESGLGAWATVFYISKYYEFADTHVLILKGKEPSFLQTYHHAGIALTLWGGVATQAAWVLIVVLLNSCIHTFMYTYFVVKTLYPRMHIPAARYLTSAQIGQFIIGLGYTAGVQVMGDRCDSAASRLVLACLQIYTVGLVGLFMAFAAKKYKNN